MKGSVESACCHHKTADVLGKLSVGGQSLIYIDWAAEFERWCDAAFLKAARLAAQLI